MKHQGLRKLAVVECDNRYGLLWLSDVLDIPDNIDNLVGWYRRIPEVGQAAVCSDPESAVRARRQRKHQVVRQATIAVGLRVGLPMAVFVEPGQPPCVPTQTAPSGPGYSASTVSSGKPPLVLAFV